MTTALHGSPDQSPARPERLGGAWLASLSGQAVQLALQSASFVLLARLLGAEMFGWRVALGAVASLVAPAAGLGFPNLLVREASRDPSSFPRAWGNALAVTGASGLALSLASVGLAQAILDVPVSALVLGAVFLADLALSRMVTVAGAAFQARGRVGAMARAGTGLHAARLAAVVACAGVEPSQRFAWWAAASLAGSLLAAALSVRAASRALGRPVVCLAGVRAGWREGLPFVASPYTQAVNNDADKLILGRFSAAEAVGAYGAAYRVLLLASVPLQSLLAVTYPLFFRHGAEGLARARAFAATLRVRAVGAGVAASLAVLLGSTLAAWVLGPGFEETAVILRWLCPVPALKAVQFLLADALTGAGFQGGRVRVQGAVAVFNLLTSLALIPPFGWGGAVATTVLSEVLLGLGLLLEVRRASAPLAPSPPPDRS